MYKFIKQLGAVIFAGFLVAVVGLLVAIPSATIAEFFFGYDVFWVAFFGGAATASVFYFFDVPKNPTKHPPSLVVYLYPLQCGLFISFVASATYLFLAAYTKFHSC